MIKLLLILLILLSGCSQKVEPTPEGTIEPTPIATPTPTPKPTPEPTPLINMEKAQEFIDDVLEPFLKNNYGENYKIKIEEDKIIAQFWEDGLAFDATYARQGDVVLGPRWRNAVNWINNNCGKYFSYFPQNDLEDAHLRFECLSDLNPEELTLMISEDGEVIFDMAKVD